MTRISIVLRTLLLGLALVFGMSSPVLADSWEAIKLRGAVFAFVGESWVQLARGDVVPDDRIIRTAPNGRVQFKRGKETIDLGPDTQIRIFDREGQKFTIVQQHFGDVAIEAERREVQHFAVQTRYLAAVVKGTRFSVSADASSASVDVARGQVEVRDVERKVMVEVTRGQSASVGSAEVLNVSGGGRRAPIVSYTGNAVAADVEAVAVVKIDKDGSISEVADASVLDATGNLTTSDSGTSVSSATSASSVIGTPAVANTANTPAASVVASTPAATKVSSSSSSSSTSTVSTSDTSSSSSGTPAVSNTSSTPAASVVASTPAATNTPPAHSNAGGKKK